MTDHLSIGVLAGLIHRDIVDDVIRECGKREKRQRLLPAHVVMYYVLALNLFFGEAYEEVLRQLVNGLKFLGNWRGNWEVPSTSAISQARARLGEAQGYCKVDLAVGGVSCLTRARRSGVPEEGDSGPG